MVSDGPGEEPKPLIQAKSMKVEISDHPRQFFLKLFLITFMFFFGDS